MGCGCGGSRAANVKYEYTYPNGQTKVVNTEIEARAMTIKYGGAYKELAST